MAAPGPCTRQPYKGTRRKHPSNVHILQIHVQDARLAQIQVMKYYNYVAIPRLSLHALVTPKAIIPSHSCRVKRPASSRREAVPIPTQAPQALSMPPVHPHPHPRPHSHPQSTPRLRLHIPPPIPRQPSARNVCRLLLREPRPRVLVAAVVVEYAAGDYAHVLGEVQARCYDEQAEEEEEY